MTKSLLDRQTWTKVWRRLDAVRVIGMVTLPFIWLLFVSLRRRRAFFQKIFTDCRNCCFLECWIIAGQGKLIDTEDSLAIDIQNAIDHQLRRAAYERGDFSSYEKLLLLLPYAFWLTREEHKPDEQHALDFSQEHGLVPTLEKYENLFNYVCFTASKEIRSLEVDAKEAPSADYWKSKVEFNKLPKPLNENTKARAVRAFHADKLRELQIGFARSHYLKIDFSLSDLTALVTLSGALLVFLGYVRVVIFSIFYEFPFQSYFGVTDYLTGGLNLTGQFLLGSTVTAMFSYGTIATSNSYSVQQTEILANSRHAKAGRFLYHFVGISSLAALIIVYIQQRQIDDLSAFATLVYFGSIVIIRVSAAFFEKPLKAYIALSLVYFCLASTLTGTLREIQRLDRASAGTPGKVLQFADTQYDELQWQFIAFTTDYVILKNRITKKLIVRARKELKSIESG